MISQSISRLSAALLAAAGVPLLFASDVILPHVVDGLPPTGAWIGQLVAAGLLAVATLNWIGQSALLGGIYGRPQVMTNFALYFVAATSTLRVATAPGAAVVWVVAGPATVMAMLYGWLLLRGPIERDLAEQATRQRPAA